MSEDPLDASEQFFEYDVAMWNKFRAARRSRQLKILGRSLWKSRKLDRNLDGADLHDCMFVYVTLDGVSLVSANFTGATFRKSNQIRNSDLSRAILSGATTSIPDQGYEFELTGSRLCGANLARSYLEFIILTDADLTDADLTEAQLSGIFERAKLRGVTAQRAHLSGNFQDADLSMADLENANLMGANMLRVNLCGADLRSASLGSADLRHAAAVNARFDGVDFRDTRLECADFQRASLTNTNLSGLRLCTTKLAGSDLSGADLSGVDLTGTDLSQARLRQANLERALLRDTNLSEADLSGARLTEAILMGANLTSANLRGADLRRAILVKTNLKKSILSGASVYGISVWDAQLDGAEQLQLLVTPTEQAPVRVDDLAIAQFIYLLLHNQEIRHVIDSISTKGVLILGRFTPERKEVLDSIRDKLRELGFVPILFDFDKPNQRDFTETIKILAGLSRFIIADITNPKSSPLELQAVVPDYMIPLVPIIEEGEEPFSMFQDLKQKYNNWVLDLLEYDSASNLLEVFSAAVVEPAIALSEELSRLKVAIPQTRHVSKYRRSLDADPPNASLYIAKLGALASYCRAVHFINVRLDTRESPGMPCNTAPNAAKARLGQPHRE